MPSRAFNVMLRKKKRETLELADLFAEVNNKPGPNTKHSLLNGGLVLLVSSWEIYCEDVCLQAAESIRTRQALGFENLDESLRKDLIQYAGGQYKGNMNPLDEKIALLAGDGWRELLCGRLADYIPDFNTPKFSRARGKNLNDLFRHVLGVRRISALIDELLEQEGRCAELDGIVTLRGEIAHTGEAPGDDRLSPDILRGHVEAFMEAAAAVDTIIHHRFREQLGFAPWQMTQPVRNALRPVAQAKV